jgi:hypothetical protein
VRAAAAAAKWRPNYGPKSRRRAMTSFGYTLSSEEHAPRELVE